MQTRTIYARQGDLLIDPVKEAPIKMRKQRKAVTIAGSDADGQHTVPAGCRYGTQGRDHYIQPTAAGTQMTHATRHNPVPLQEGVIYHVWPQIERRGEGDVDVED